MAKYSLHIDCEDVHELASISNRLAGIAGVTEPARPVATVVYSGEVTMPDAAPVAEAAKRGRKPKDTPLSGSPAPAVDVSQTETPAESATTAATATTIGEQSSTPAPAPTPAPAADGAAVTYEDLKAALTKLMEKKSAKVAQETLKKSVGFGSLSSTPPDKYGAALAAINAELAT